MHWVSAFMGFPVQGLGLSRQEPRKLFGAPPWYIVAWLTRLRRRASITTFLWWTYEKYFQRNTVTKLASALPSPPVSRYWLSGLTIFQWQPWYNYVQTYKTRRLQNNLKLEQLPKPRSMTTRSRRSNYRSHPYDKKKKKKNTESIGSKKEANRVEVY